jgi:hypothetical protein
VSLQAVIEQLPSLGVAGLLFVMWWYERQERVRSGTATQQSQCQATHLLDINDHLLDVIRTNTAALAALREEFRTHRETAAAWFDRLGRQLERLDAA